jgi:uncharacterized membrane protein SpoIIM required for sporulation
MPVSISRESATDLLISFSFIGILSFLILFLHAHYVPLFAQTVQKAEFKALFGIIIPHSLPEASLKPY